MQPPPVDSPPVVPVDDDDDVPVDDEELLDDDDVLDDDDELDDDELDDDELDDDELLTQARSADPSVSAASISSKSLAQAVTATIDTTQRFATRPCTAPPSLPGPRPTSGVVTPTRRWFGRSVPLVTRGTSAVTAWRPPTLPPAWLDGRPQTGDDPARLDLVGGRGSRRRW